ncbi:MAG: hypothetical protein H7178_03740, partial [Chitinophagaceae bacterium]|nr:hypothetical protein [Chitinophagaceae bacterium]
MKKILLSAVFGFIALAVSAQIKNPVSWTFESKKKASGMYDVIISANVEKGWHIYSQNTGSNGPIPTKITFKQNPLVNISGKTAEKGKIEKFYDKNFKTNVLYYANKVVFVQSVKNKNNVKTNIVGTLEYMVCDDSQCLPP